MIYRRWRKAGAYVPPEGKVSLAIQATPGLLPGLRAPGVLRVPKERLSLDWARDNRSAPTSGWKAGQPLLCLKGSALSIQLSLHVGPMKHSTVKSGPNFRPCSK